MGDGPRGSEADVSELASDVVLLALEVLSVADEVELEALASVLVVALSVSLVVSEVSVAVLVNVTVDGEPALGDELESLRYSGLVPVPHAAMPTHAPVTTRLRKQTRRKPWMRGEDVRCVATERVERLERT